MPWTSDMDSFGAPLAVVYRSASRRDCLDRALALEAVGIEYQLHFSPGDCALLVRTADAAQAAAEVEAYAAENRQPPTAPAPPPPLTGAWYGALVYFVVVMLVTGLTYRGAFGQDWMDAGATNAGLVRGGQWWRVVTALTLHLDLLHLAGNILFGVLFGLFVGQRLGAGVAWLGILIAGAAGNALNALVQPADHQSVGASTAVFAALGMLAALDWTRRGAAERSATRRWIPIIGGAALLAMMGLEGERTDFMAHLAGFATGLATGRLLAPIRESRLHHLWLQATCGAAAVLTVVLAWRAALWRD